MEAKLYVNGEWIETKSGRVVEDRSPSDGSLVARAHMAGPDEVERAIAAAQAAFPVWAARLPAEREEYLLKAAEHLAANSEKYTRWLIDESGSCFMKAADEVAQCVSIFRAAAGECRRVNGGVVQPDTPGQVSTYVRVPLGVVAGIAPFNYPLLLSLGKVAPAIAVGNTFVLKPAGMTPLSGRIIAECMDAAGLPAGVFNLTPGPGDVVGGCFTADPRVRMVTFTGSTAVGRSLALRCAESFKRVTLEMGGKNPMIVLRDFDPARAAAIALFGAFFHQGQICMCTSRVIVEEPIYNAFCARFAELAKQLAPMDPHKPEAIIGPLIDIGHCKVLDEHIRDAVDKGARLLCGGGHEGNYYEASVLADVTPEMKVFREESFGPLTSVVRAKDREDALRLANDNVYGLSAALLTNDLAAALSLAPRIEAGMVHVNDSTVLGSRQAPFGGVKQSGVGREGGSFSTEEFTELKWITYQVQPLGYPTGG